LKYSSFRQSQRKQIGSCYGMLITELCEFVITARYVCFQARLCA